MHGKFIQISTAVTDASVVVYGLTADGKIYEKLVGVKGSSWLLVS